MSDSIYYANVLDVEFLNEQKRNMIFISYCIASPIVSAVTTVIYSRYQKYATSYDIANDIYGNYLQDDIMNQKAPDSRLWTSDRVRTPSYDLRKLTPCDATLGRDCYAVCYQKPNPGFS
jgi:hypothetical protein